MWKHVAISNCFTMARRPYKTPYVGIPWTKLFKKCIIGRYKSFFCTSVNLVVVPAVSWVAFILCIAKFMDEGR